MASDLFLFTNQFNNITLVHSISHQCINVSILGHCLMWVSTGETSLQIHVVMSRHVDEGARLSELLVS